MILEPFAARFAPAGAGAGIAVTVEDARAVVAGRFVMHCGGMTKALLLFDSSASGEHLEIFKKLASACNSRDEHVTRANVLAIGAGAAGFVGQIVAYPTGDVACDLLRGDERVSGNFSDPGALKVRLQLPTDTRFIVGWLLGVKPGEERASDDLDRLGRALAELSE